MPGPSLRYELASIHGEMRNSRTEYILGRNSRSESRDCRGYCDGDPNQPLRAYIQNRDLHYCFQLDLESGVYTASRVNEYVPKITKRQSSGRTVHVHMQTIDTGERREMYGHTARRVITRSTHRVSPESVCGLTATEVDGWYIDPPAAWLALYPPQPGSYSILQVNGQFDNPVFTHDGAREMGFPMLLTRTHRSSFTDADGNVRDHTSVDRQEVTEFSEDSLAYELFVPPKDFHRVLQLPGETPLPLALRMRLGWEKLRDTFAAKR